MFGPFIIETKGTEPLTKKTEPNEVFDALWIAEYTRMANSKHIESPVEKAHDPVNHPKHYTSHPSGVECIMITEHYGFNLGNVIKYLWRAEEKGAPLEDLKKARWYLDREIQKRENQA